jgi:hypothetical protein
MVPVIDCPVDHRVMVSRFNELRAFVGDIDKPLNMGVVLDWQMHSGIKLERWERDCMFSMCRALRHAYSDVLKFHMKRTKVKA